MQGKLNVHSENILPIIKKWLYSEKDIFVRELISNACDAIEKVKILQDRGIVSNVVSPSIEVTIDRKAKTLTFSDTGVGMDDEEVVKYLAQIAFSGAEEFAKAYEAKDRFIGHFGLGFYSAFMVANLVEVETLSCKEGAKPVLFKSDGTSGYEVLEGKRTTPGTDIVLHLTNDSEEYLDESVLRKIMERFCSFFSTPISLNKNPIRSFEPLWLKSPNECSKNEYLEFFRKLYPMEREPLFWVHLNVDYPFHVRGILYFPTIGPNFDFKKSYVRLFSHRVFVSEDCKDILPEFLSVLKGAIDSPDIPLNVSRSHLQMDTTVRKVASHVAKKVGDSLLSLYREDKERFESIWNDIEFIVKLGIMQDEKFYQQVKEIIGWKSTKGEWVSLNDYLEKQDGEKIVYYVTTEHPPQDLLKLYDQKGHKVISASKVVDAALMSFLERELKDVKFRRIDAQVDSELLDSSREKSLLDSEGRSESSKISDFIRSAIDSNVEVETKSFADDELSCLLLLPEEERRVRDYLVNSAKHSPISELDKKKFVVNTNSSLINSIYKLNETKNELAKELIQHLYELQLISHDEFDVKDRDGFIQRSRKLLDLVAKS